MNKRLTSTLLLPMLNEIEAARAIVPQIRREWVDEIIVIDDGSEDLPTSREMKMSLEGQVLDQFQRRRMLYANPAYDLTDKLIVRMNNARAAGAPAPATTAPNAK